MNIHATGRTSNFLRVQYYLALTLSTLLSSQVSGASRARKPYGFGAWGNSINFTSVISILSKRGVFTVVSVVFPFTGLCRAYSASDQLSNRRLTVLEVILLALRG